MRVELGLPYWHLTPHIHLASRHLGVYLNVSASNVSAKASFVSRYPACMYLSISCTANVASRSATGLTTTSFAASRGHSAIACSACAAIMMRSASPWARINAGMARSEEHTSELQSPCNLVCRLLLEKKKSIHRPYIRKSRAAVFFAIHKHS